MNTKLIIIFAILAGSLATTPLVKRKRRQSIGDVGDFGPIKGTSPNQDSNPSSTRATTPSTTGTDGTTAAPSDDDSLGIFSSIGEIIKGAVSLPVAIVSTVFSTIGDVFSGIFSIF